jgi:hypothetical protein
MSINIKNYTSSVNSDKSILEIERILIDMGARNIAKEYDGFGNVSAVSFSIPNKDSNIPFRLPGKIEPIKKLFLQQYKRPSQVQMKQCEDQARRTAWRNVKEWVQLQHTMIKLEQVEFMEVFMPYMYNMSQGKTIFEISKENNHQKLLA